MRRIVLDASAALGWLFSEGPSAAPLGRSIKASELLAPWLWRLEVANAVLVRERRKLLTETQGARLLQLIDELGVELAPEPANRSALLLAQMARPHQLTAYDAVYLELAIREGLPLLTSDTGLRSAAVRAGVKLVNPI